MGHGYFHSQVYACFVNSNSQRVPAVGQRMDKVEVSVKGGWFIRIQIMLKREMIHLIYLNFTNKFVFGR